MERTKRMVHRFFGFFIFTVSLWAQPSFSADLCLRVLGGSSEVQERVVFGSTSSAQSTLPVVSRAQNLKYIDGQLGKLPPTPRRSRGASNASAGATTNGSGVQSTSLSFPIEIIVEHGAIKDLNALFPKDEVTTAATTGNRVFLTEFRKALSAGNLKLIVAQALDLPENEIKVTVPKMRYADFKGIRISTEISLSHKRDFTYEERATISTLIDKELSNTYGKANSAFAESLREGGILLDGNHTKWYRASVAEEPGVAAFGRLIRERGLVNMKDPSNQLDAWVTIKRSESLREKHIGNLNFRNEREYLGSIPAHDVRPLFFDFLSLSDKNGGYGTLVLSADAFNFLRKSGALSELDLLRNLLKDFALPHQMKPSLEKLLEREDHLDPRQTIGEGSTLEYVKAIRDIQNIVSKVVPENLIAVRSTPTLEGAIHGGLSADTENLGGINQAATHRVITRILFDQTIAHHRERMSALNSAVQKFHGLRDGKSENVTAHIDLNAKQIGFTSDQKLAKTAAQDLLSLSQSLRLAERDVTRQYEIFNEMLIEILGRYGFGKLVVEGRTLDIQKTGDDLNAPFLGRNDSPNLTPRILAELLEEIKSLIEVFPKKYEAKLKEKGETLPKFHYPVTFSQRVAAIGSGVSPAHSFELNIQDGNHSFIGRKDLSPANMLATHGEEIQKMISKYLEKRAKPPRFAIYMHAKEIGKGYFEIVFADDVKPFEQSQIKEIAAHHISELNQALTNSIGLPINYQLHRGGN